MKINGKKYNIEAYADLQGVDLRRADLRGADLQGANLDFSCFPLWCGSFDIIVDDELVTQLLTHIKRLNTTRCSEKVKKQVRNIPKWVEDDLKRKHDI